jgi:hypothetical protein
MNQQLLSFLRNEVLSFEPGLSKVSFAEDQNQGMVILLAVVFQDHASSSRFDFQIRNLFFRSFNAGFSASVLQPCQFVQ